ncbi:MAG: hypothetical protein U1E76_18990 [Planctomycetota bacterium]
MYGISRSRIEQAAALDAITDSLDQTVPGAFLLFGVTGSQDRGVPGSAIQHRHRRAPASDRAGA